MSYERACTATPRDEYYTNILETLIYHNDRHNAPLSSEKLRQEFSIVMEETEEEESDAKHDTNNVTMYNLFNHSTISPSQGEIENVRSVHSTIPPSQENANVKHEMRIDLDIMKETIKEFSGLMIQSTIRDSAYHN